MADVHLTYVTDPACPFSWAAEPALSRLRAAYGNRLRTRYVMGGMAREFTRPTETMAHVLDAAAQSGMPVDPRVWLEDAPRSSFGASRGVKAAGLQGLDGPYLRAAREALMCDRRRLDEPGQLTELAATVPGLDAERFAADVVSPEVEEAFAADMAFARETRPEHHNASGRLPFPSFLVGDGGIYDDVDGDALLALAGDDHPAPPPAVPDALALHRRMAAVEVAAVCELGLPAVQAQLWQLRLAGRVREERILTGELWSSTT